MSMADPPRDMKIKPHVAVVSPYWAQEILANPKSAPEEIERAHAATTEIPCPTHELQAAAQDVIAWENEYRTINHSGKYPPHPFVRLAIALANAKLKS